MNGEVQLNCFTNTQVEWSQVRKESDTPVVYIWRAFLPSILVYADDLHGYLDDGELAKSKRYHFEHDARRYVLSRALLKMLIGGIFNLEADTIQIIPGPNKKPIIKNSDASAHFNISHSGDWLLIAIASTEIGIDIERTDRSHHFDDIIEHSFSEPEKNMLNASLEKLYGFYVLWTRKEAISKATSKGITDDYRRTTCLDGVNTIAASIIQSEKDWNLMSFEVDETHVATIAYPPPLELHLMDLSYPFPSDI